MIKWTYLLVYDDAVGSRTKVKNFLDKEASIANWKYCLPNCFFIVSYLTASQLSDLILDKLSHRRGRFIILDTATDRGGWLPKDVWELMKNPKAVGEN